jgi:hypothetical protein
MIADRPPAVLPIAPQDATNAITRIAVSPDALIASLIGR